MKRIAIATWQGRVGSTLDFANSLLLVDIENGRSVERREVSITCASPRESAARCEELGVNTVVCGAISRCLANGLEMRGIRVVPFVSGNVEDIVRAFQDGKLDDQSYLMAGCRPGARRAWRCRHGKGGRRGV